MKKLVVLHITLDEKFFDSVFSEWEKNEDFDNKALLYAPKKNYEFRYIKRTNVLEIYHNTKAIRKRLQRNDYNVVYFHSMPVRFYQFATWIPKDKKVIWWGWGYDIYYSQFGLPSIVKLDLYRSKTLRFVKTQRFMPLYIIRRIAQLIIQPILKKKQILALQRIDYFQPVVKLEMDLLSRNNIFRAKEFYYKTSIPVIEKYEPKPSDGNIMIGNSATPSNNHLDVLEVVQRLKQASQNIIIPLSYGDNKYKTWLKPYVQRFDLYPLYEFMPRDRYFKMIDTCSYAIFGTIRQQAMGNIGHSISQGIKVFLYKDSIAYQNLKNLGYVVFAIEDMTEKSLRTPLTKEQMDQNNKAILSEYYRRLAVYNSFINEVKQTMSS